jgi:hypothetical protein
MEARWAPRREEGFAIVESLLAATVLLVGLLGMGVMLTGAATATATSKAREQGVALQRELVEAARGIPYDQLQPGAVVGRVVDGADAERHGVGHAAPAGPPRRSARRSWASTARWRAQA